MNEIYSRDELNYKPRWLSARIATALDDHPVVVLTGARQVGKSTLLRHSLPMRDWRYVTMDSPDALAQSMRDPGALWAGTQTVVLDEAQKSPGLLPAIKLAVDQNNRRGLRFVISGSANLLLMHQVSESLAGRAVYFVLNPMTVGEQLGRPAPMLLEDLFAGNLPKEGKKPNLPEIDIAQWALRGFMPTLFEFARHDSWTQWWEGYVATYLERDLRQLANITATLDFRRVMQLAALRNGQMLNQTEISRDAQVSQPTTHRYLNLIEASHLAQRVPIYANNHSIRLVKAPKIYWSDTGLAAYLSGYFDVESLRSSREYGAFFESMVFQHLSTLSQLLLPKAAVFGWRTQRGEEVDFVLERGRSVVAFEAKLSKRVNFSDAAGLNAFVDKHAHTTAAVILYCGDEVVRLGEKVIAMPWQMIASG